MIPEILEILGLVSSLPKEKNGNENLRIILKERKLISDRKIIDKVIKTFELISEDNQNWTKTYFEKNLNESWLSYYVNTSQNGGGQNILVKLPIPTIKKLIEIAINAKDEDEVFAACYTLTQNEENDKTEFRLELITELEKISDRIRQQKIVKFTSLLNSLNRKDILGKSLNEIELDSKYYKEIAERATKL
jgi:hypothetical protein